MGHRRRDAGAGDAQAARGADGDPVRRAGRPAWVDPQDLLNGLALRRLSPGRGAATGTRAPSAAACGPPAPPSAGPVHGMTWRADVRIMRRSFHVSVEDVQDCGYDVRP